MVANEAHGPPLKVAGAVLLVLCAATLLVVWVQFRGGFYSQVRLTILSSRAGLVMDPGSKVTYNGLAVGRVTSVDETEIHGVPAARISLDIEKKYLVAIPSNVDASITASTVFGNKYISLLSPDHPDLLPISADTVIDARAVTTEFNTLFETIMSISEKVDPVKLNATLTATAEALNGLGERFGQSLRDGELIMARLNDQMPQINHDIRRLAELADVYSDASPHLWGFLSNATATAHTVNAQRHSLDTALLEAIGFGDTAAPILEKGSPYLVRALSDLERTATLLNDYSPELFCLIRNYHDVSPQVAAAEGDNGYSIHGINKILGAENPYVYPDNLPRVSARGGPGGAPGCWQPINRDLWPAPYLVMDTGASVAPYNHVELGHPLMIDYVWGRQVGENTINP
ncbi:MCE family protein [Mycolicibacterium septicum]|uniref:MCE family protein n=1 Tax=Mycolicibacterium septicum TaxID=98668 RepID=UPI0005C98802|nr:MCE family protein [Mycolicibacterium septicum]